MKKTSQDEILRQKIAEEKEKRRQAESIGSRDADPNLKPISEALDNYYFVNKLSLYCVWLSLKNMMNPESINCKEGDLLFITEIIKHIDVVEPTHPTIVIYNKIRKLFERIEEESAEMDKLFDITYNNIKTNEPIHADGENLEFYSLLNNYCIKRINKGRSGYKRLSFMLNNEMINLQYTGKPENQISMQPSLFRNLVAVALTLEEPSFFYDLKTYGLEAAEPNIGFRNADEWAEKFIQFYGNKLAESKQTKFYYKYCCSLLEFSRGNFTKAYEIFNNTMRVQGSFLNLDMKILHLKILYEIKVQKGDRLEYDRIEIHQILDAYRKLLGYEKSKKQKLRYQVDFYANFEKIYKKLFGLYFTYDGRIDNARNKYFLQKKEELKNLIQSNNHSYKNWFQEKLEAIK